MSLNQIRNTLSGKGLKVTPQRIAVLESFTKLKHHPTTDQIIAFIRKNHPNIATGTVYKALERFVEEGILQRVKTDRDVMRYDPVPDHHHHFYCEGSDRIEDYFDDELNELLLDYFAKKEISGFRIKEITLQIRGKFN